MRIHKSDPVPQVEHLRAHSTPRWDLWLVAIVIVIAKLAGVGQQ